MIREDCHELRNILTLLSTKDKNLSGEEQFFIIKDTKWEWYVQLFIQRETFKKYFGREKKELVCLGVIINMNKFICLTSVEELRSYNDYSMEKYTCV